MAAERRAAHPDDRNPLTVLEISGSLEVTVGDEHIAIVVDQQQITAQVSLKRHLRRALAALTREKPLIRTLAAGLSAKGLTLTIIRKGAPIARLGAETTPSVVGALLGIPHFAIFPRKPKR
jgi:hypothetical protein